MALLKLQSRRFLYALIAFGALILADAVLGTPIQLILSSDIDYQTTVLPTVWDFLTNLSHYLFYWLGFGIVLFGSDGKNLSDKLPLCGIYGLAVLMRYPLCLIASVLTVPPDEDYTFLTDSLPEMLLEMGFDLLQLAVVLAVFYFTVCKKESTEPMPKILLAVAAGLPVGLQILMRIRYDVILGVGSSSDVLWMILYYSGDLLCFALGYFLFNKCGKCKEIP